MQDECKSQWFQSYHWDRLVCSAHLDFSLSSLTQFLLQLIDLDEINRREFKLIYPKLPFKCFWVNEMIYKKSLFSSFDIKLVFSIKNDYYC